MAIFESNGLYDLLSLMRHNGIININRKVFADCKTLDKKLSDAVVVIFDFKGGALYANNFNYHSEFSKTT